MELCKDFFYFLQDIFVSSFYIPPANSSRERKLNVDHFTNLNEQILKYRSQCDILCGTLLETSLILYHQISSIPKAMNFS